MDGHRQAAAVAHHVVAADADIGTLLDRPGRLGERDVVDGGGVRREGDGGAEAALERQRGGAAIGTSVLPPSLLVARCIVHWPAVTFHVVISARCTRSVRL